MIISGSGSIAAGNYNESITISGSGLLAGDIECESLIASGAVTADGNVTVREEAKISGSAHFCRHLTADRVSVSGSTKVDKDLTCKTELKVAGNLTVYGRVRSTSLLVAGAITADEGIDADEITVSGGIRCKGLINAERVQLFPSGRVGSIGGSEILVKKNHSFNFLQRPLLSVEELIEGDIVELERVSVPKVTGRVVKIGEKCSVDLVQYSEEIEIHPKATVKTVEKI